MEIGFLGSYEHTLDEKERVNIPAKFKKEIESTLESEYRNKLILTAGQTADGKKYIDIFPVDKWNKVASEYEESEIKEYWNGPIDKTKDERIRKKMEYSYPVNMDKSGRIIIPPKLKEYAEIKKEVVFIGRKYRIEMWDKETLNK